MTVEELIQKFLDIVEGLKSQPTGARGYGLFGKKQHITGNAASEKAAKEHSSLMKFYNLKSNFEKLGMEYSIAPALLAGIASRESSMGRALRPATEIYWDGETVLFAKDRERNLFHIMVLEYYS